MDLPAPATLTPLGIGTALLATLVWAVRMLFSGDLVAGPIHRQILADRDAQISYLQAALGNAEKAREAQAGQVDKLLTYAQASDRILTTLADAARDRPA